MNGGSAEDTQVQINKNSLSTNSEIQANFPKLSQNNYTKKIQ